MKIINWLLEGDVSLQYQVKRDLLDDNQLGLKERIIQEGYGKKLIDLQKDGYYWGQHYYQPKWISTHYSLLELRHLECDADPRIMSAINYICDNLKTKDGGISPNPRDWNFSDVCLNGMNLYSFCFFGVAQDKITSVIDFILTQQMRDGGYNCYYNDPRYEVKHGSLHSTISLIEGMNEYINQGYLYRLEEVKEQREHAIEFVLQHQLFISDRTGEVINKKFLMLSFPPRWKYDILRGLEALVNANIAYDKRIEPAIEVVLRKRRKDGTWPLQNKHPGQVHFDFEKPGKPSRFNTMRVLRVLKYFKPEVFQDFINQS